MNINWSIISESIASYLHDTSWVVIKIDVSIIFKEQKTLGRTKYAKILQKIK